MTGHRRYFAKGPGKEAEHQIDVTATDATGERRRVIIETRDRNDSMDLKQVRDFQGVIHQIEPDQAWIISPTGFTDDAVKYARDERVGLAVLRPTTEGEDDRIKAIHMTLKMQALGTPTITSWTIATEEERLRIHELLRDHDGETHVINASTEYVYDADGEPVSTLEKALTPIFNSLDLELGENVGTHTFEQNLYVDILGHRAPVSGFSYSVRLDQGVTEFTVGNPAGVAELIFCSIEGTVGQDIDRVIYDTELAGLALDETGRVITRPTAK